MFRVWQSSLDAHLPILDELWTSGCRNGAAIWRQLRAKGFRGSSRVAGEWATRRRRAERASDQQLQKVPSARTIARLMTMARTHLSKAHAVTIAARGWRADASGTRELIDRFQAMIRRRIVAELDPWIEEGSASLIASFANGITKDKHAVSAAITVPPTVRPRTDHKLKLVKRRMYGRGKLDLLQARLIGAV